MKARNALADTVRLQGTGQWAPAGHCPSGPDFVSKSDSATITRTTSENGHRHQPNTVANNLPIHQLELDWLKQLLELNKHGQKVAGELRHVYFVAS